MNQLHRIGDHVEVAETRQTTRGRWHILQTQAGLDEQAHEILRRSRYEIYRPMVLENRKVMRRNLSRAQRASLGDVRITKPMLVPFFPGYAFIRFDAAAGRHHEIFRIVGVRGLVSNGDLPRQVSDEMIAMLRQREVDGSIPGGTPLSEFGFDLGELVRISTGPFASFPATITRLPKLRGLHRPEMTVEELDESTRVQLLVHVFGRDTPLTMTASSIEKL